MKWLFKKMNLVCKYNTGKDFRGRFPRDKKNTFLSYSPVLL